LQGPCDSSHRACGVAEVRVARVTLHVADLQVRHHDFALQHLILRRFARQTVEILERAFDQQRACWRRARKILNRIVELEQIRVRQLPHALNRCSAFARSMRATRACQLVITIPPTSATTVSAAAITTALCRRTNFELR
jgi:hypothetical protein